MKTTALVRVGAAAFLAGVWLGGPVPIAGADNVGVGSASDARSGSGPQRAAAAGGRESTGPRRPGAAAATSTIAEVPNRRSARVGALRGGGTPAPSAELQGGDNRLPQVGLPEPAAAITPGPADGVIHQRTTRPVAAPAATVPAASVAERPTAIPALQTPAAPVTVPAVPAAASAPSLTPSAATAARKPLKESAFAAAAALDRILATAQNWLSGLPPTGPDTAPLQGALQLIRRNLFGFAEKLGPSVGWGPKATSVEFKNRSNQRLVLQLDPDGVRGGTPGDAVFLDPGQTTTFSGYHNSDGTNAVDIRVLVGLADEPAATSTRMVFVANNPWNSEPWAYVAAADPTSLLAGKDLNQAYFAYKDYSGGEWRLLEEGEDCHCDAPDSGGPAYGPQVYVARKDDSGTKNFYVEIFDAGQYPTEDYPLAKYQLYYCNGEGAKLPDANPFTPIAP